MYKRFLANQLSTSYLAFAGGIQLAVGMELLVNLYFAGPGAVSVSFIVAGGALFLLASFFSMALAWTCSFIALTAKRVEDTCWPLKKEVYKVLDEHIRFLFGQRTRSVKMAFTLLADGLLTIAALALGIVGRVC